jgi:hypothetical protein
MSDDNNNQEVQEGQLNIELSEEIGDGEYANLAVITHSPSEFVIDFIKAMPNVPKAKVKSRVIITPQHAKRLVRAIQDNIVRYEQAHGPITEPEGQQNSFPMNFGGPAGRA